MESKIILNFQKAKKIMSLQFDYLVSIKKQFLYYKTVGEKAMEQLEPEQLFISVNEDTNSIAVIIKHLSGNMISRWTDFLTSDGEKEWRNRDTEFEEQHLSKKQLIDLWEKGWQCLLDALNALAEDDLLKTIYIRSESLLVVDAVNRQLAHYPYHVGQIIYVAKIITNNNWQNLSIAKGNSSQFNNQMNTKK